MHATVTREEFTAGDNGRVKKTCVTQGFSLVLAHSPKVVKQFQSENLLGPPGFEPRTPAWHATTITMSLKSYSTVRPLGMALPFHSSRVPPLFYESHASTIPTDIQRNISRAELRRYQITSDTTKAIPKGEIFWVCQDLNPEPLPDSKSL